MSTRKVPSAPPTPRDARRQFELLVEVLGAGQFRSGLGDRPGALSGTGREPLGSGT